MCNLCLLRSHMRSNTCFPSLNSQNCKKCRVSNCVHIVCCSSHENVLYFSRFVMAETNCGIAVMLGMPLIECFYMTSQRPYWCPKTIKLRSCWCPKPLLWEFNLFCSNIFAGAERGWVVQFSATLRGWVTLFFTNY